MPTIDAISGCAKSNGRLCIGLLLALIFYYLFMNNSETALSLLLTFSIGPLIFVTMFCYRKFRTVAHYLNIKLRKAIEFTQNHNDTLYVYKVRNNKNSDNNFQTYMRNNLTICLVHNNVSSLSLEETIIKFFSKMQRCKLARLFSISVAIVLNLDINKPDCDRRRSIDAGALSALPKRTYLTPNHIL